MCGYVYTGFIDCMLKAKSLQDYTNLFSPNKNENNAKIIPTIFSLTKRLR